MPKKDKLKIDKVKLMRVVNDLLGRDALLRLQAGLTEPELEKFVKMLRKGKLTLHNESDGFIGFCCGTSNEGFELKEGELNQAIIDNMIARQQHTSNLNLEINIGKVKKPKSIKKVKSK